jgi:2-polyprenyl-3-methyl-5-hydroxy-6-metoxy-1,4-benzoquinol methylase
MFMGKPVIATGYSGNLDYMTAANSYLVDHELHTIGTGADPYPPDARWAEPDLDHAAELMRDVYERRAEWRARASRGAERLRERYSLEAVGRAARAKLSELLERTNRAKPRRAGSPERARSLAPDVPVPGAWYDADYFERGVKSNWSGGYSWRGFEGLFRQTAAFLTETFAEADAFLDAGCAKGFLVRALREAGKDARGFDHSPWAIEHADAATKPFLTLAGADDFDFAPGCDVLTAFSLLESLTEEQIASFLRRARGHTRQALLAVVSSFDSEREIESYRRASRDLSQITLRTRAWWREQFVAAGWRQGALGRIAERACQSQQLPARMGWKVYVYSPE